MGKRKILAVATSIILAALVAAAIALFFIQERQRRQDELNSAYRAENTHVAAVRETVVLNSDEDLEGLRFGGYVASFPWEGTMEMGIVEAKAYGSLEEAGLDVAKAIGPVATDGFKRIVVFKVQIKNRDAELHKQDVALFHEVNDFYISTFINLMDFDSGGRAGVIGDIVYFDGTDPDADPHKGMLAFALGKGQEKELSVGVEVPADKLKKNLFVGIGDAFYEKYRIKVDLSRAS